jgi:hypothetical protein
MDREINFKIKVSKEGKNPADEFRDISKEAKIAEAATKKAMGEYEKATNAAAKAQENLAKVSADKSKNMVEGWKKLGEGAVALGRGIGLAGVATSESMEKAIKQFARFEAGVQLFKGFADSIEGARKIWATYTAASKAAAAADTAAAAAAALRSRASMGAGVAGAASGAVSGAGAAAGGAAALGGAGAAAGGLAALAAAALPVITALAIVAAVAFTLGAIFPKFGKSMRELITGTDEAAEAAKKTSETYKKVSESLDSWRKENAQEREQTQAVSSWSKEKSTLTMQAAGMSPLAIAQQKKEEALARLGKAQATFNETNTNLNQVSSATFNEKAPEDKGYFQKNTSEKWGHFFGSGKTEEQQGHEARKQEFNKFKEINVGRANTNNANAKTDLDAAREEAKEAIKAAAEEERKAKQTAAQEALKSEQERAKEGEKQLRSAQEKTKTEQDGLKAVRDKLKAEQDRLKSAQERFVDLDPLERKKVVEAQQKANRGEELSKEDRDRLRGDGLNQDLIESDTAKKVAKLSAEEQAYFGNQNAKVSAAQTEEQNLSKQVEEAKASEAKLSSALDSLNAAVAEKEQGMKDVEAQIKSSAQWEASALLKIMQENREEVIREVQAQQKLQNHNARINQNATINGGGK